MSNSLTDWLKNDPDPMKTIDLVKQKQERNRKLSAEDPVRLMRMMMTKDEFDGFWEYKRKLEDDFLINKGYSIDKTMKASWYVPQLVVSANPEYWDNIFRTKQYNKYPYFLLGNPFANKTLNVKSHFQA